MDMRQAQLRRQAQLPAQAREMSAANLKLLSGLNPERKTQPERTAHVAPRKGLHALLDAYERIPQMNLKGLPHEQRVLAPVLALLEGTAITQKDVNEFISMVLCFETCERLDTLGIVLSAVMEKYKKAGLVLDFHNLAQDKSIQIYCPKHANKVIVVLPEKKPNEHRCSIGYGLKCYDRILMSTPNFCPDNEADSKSRINAVLAHKGAVKFIELSGPNGTSGN